MDSTISMMDEGLEMGQLIARARRIKPRHRKSPPGVSAAENGFPPAVVLMPPISEVLCDRMTHSAAWRRAKPASSEAVPAGPYRPRDSRPAAASLIGTRVSPGTGKLAWRSPSSVLYTDVVTGDRVDDSGASSIRSELQSRMTRSRETPDESASSTAFPPPHRIISFVCAVLVLSSMVIWCAWTIIAAYRLHILARW